MKNEEESNIVELIGDDGEPAAFEHLMTLEHKGRSYVLLTPVEPETPDEEGMVVIMRIETREGEDCYIVEEDEAVLDAVFERFQEMSEEMWEDEEEDEEDEEE